MKRESLYFAAPRKIEVKEEELAPLEPGQVLVENHLSAISPGTEMLIYRGQAPEEMETDLNIEALAGSLDFPLKYGYASVGKVVEIGSEVEETWKDRLVFSFNPHESHFSASRDQLIPLPDGVSVEDAIFLPNMESAVNFIMDGQPMMGEQVVVFGQGIVGLLTCALLAKYPLSTLITLDQFPLRREASLQAGAHHSLDASKADALEQARALLTEGREYPGADLSYELTGNPAVLDEAIAVTGFNGRVLVSSWYGQKRAPIDLGGYFHRSRIRLISSQVSTLTPELSGRWSKERRFAIAWDMLGSIRPSRFITQRFSLSEAAEAYQMIDENAGECIQVVFEYAS